MDKSKNTDAERESVAPKTETAHSHPAPEPAKEGPGKADKAAAGHAKKVKNNVRKMRTERMMSKAELARRAGMSTLTIDRVERGLPCRMDTKRKILEALGLKPTDRVAVFGDEED
jgi:DNA-binding XRE family transcriptional regulator